MTTIRDYARDHRVSYEAIRSQVSRYREDLDGHIITKGRTKYLDDFAVEFLNSKRKDDPVSVVTVEKSEIIDSLRDQIEALKNELMTTQKRVIELQSENQKMIEAKIKYDLLLESSNEKQTLIEGLREDLKDAKKETDAAKRDADQARDDLKSARADADQIRKQADEALEKSEKLKKERDAAAKEAKSYKKSIFGFYRKVKN